MKDSTISSEAFDSLAYTFGFFLGDGSLKVDRRRKNSFAVRFAKMDIDPIERVRNELETVFDFKWNINNNPSGRRNKGDFFILNASGRDVFEFFAFNTAFRTQCPEYYFSTEKPIQLQVLAGLIDSDGSICSYRGVQPRCVNESVKITAFFGNSVLALTKAVESLCRMNGIRTGKVREVTTTHKPSYVITLNPRDLWDKKVPLVNKRRIEALKEYIDYRNERSETKSSRPKKGKI